jgi:DHA1 family tetracycline resistance protein-like MFS transporter
VNAARSGRSARTFIYLTIAIDSLGLGLLVPVMPELIETLSGRGLREAAVYAGVITALFAAMQFLAAPALGSLSDRYGRRPVLLASLAAFGANYLLMAFAPTLAWLFVAQALAGVFGATPSTAAAYIADVSEPEERPRLFGLLGAAFGVGFTLGPMIGGLLVGISLRAPFFAAAGLALVNVLYGVFVLPESLAPELRRPFRLSRANPLGALLHLKNHHVAGSLLLALLLLHVANHTLPATWPYFTMHSFGWTASMVGYSLGLFGICTIVTQGAFIGSTVHRYGISRALYFGLTATIVGYLGFAFAPNGWLLVLLILPATMGYMSASLLSSLMSTHVPPTEQGVLQGVVASLRSLAAIITPLTMPPLFSQFASKSAIVYLPGAPYVAAGALTALGFWLVRRSIRTEPAHVSLRGQKDAPAP